LHSWHKEPLRWKRESQTQAATVDEPLPDVEFEGHCTHVSASCTLAEKGWNVFAAHGVQATLAALAWKLPSGHAAHATPA